MRYIITIISFFNLIMIANAQSGPGDYAPIIKKQADIMAQAFVKKDYKTYTKFMHPKDIAEMGGEKAAIDTLKKAEQHMKEYGMTISYILVNEPSWVVDTAGEMQCTVVETIELNVKGGRVRNDIAFIGISKDKGKHWVFIDTSTNFKNLRKDFPTLSSRLNIPVPTQPVFEKD
jgi:hypothetical protein